MAAIEYKIKIDNEIVGLEKVNVATDPQRQLAPDKAAEALKQQASMSGVGKTIAIILGKQALNYVVSNYGNLTGDYVTQQNIQAGIEIASTVALLASGPVGTVVAAGNIGVRLLNDFMTREKHNRDVEILRMRTGMMGYSGGRL